MKSFKYELLVFWSAEDRTFVVDVPELPGCMAHGDTPAHAVANAQGAIGLWIDSAREMGRPIPRPRSRRAMPA
jgi:predicted RNase H-like HicB family nuclease